MKLHEIVATLKETYGLPPPAPVTDPWEQIVHINASYLVDDDRRMEVFESLRDRVGLAPREILDAPRGKLEAAIERGGMKPPMRADKLVKAAEIAEAVGEPLSEVVTRPFDEAGRVLRKFPGVGAPVAERIALFAGAHPVLALESNGLRVLVRLGFGEEHERYEKTWRSVREAVDREAPADVAWCIETHQLLRLHGRTICKNTRPRCAECALRADCPSA